MKVDGEDVINLAVGEPDFDTPSHVIRAAITAMQAGQTRYTHVAGTLTLRQAVCDSTKGTTSLATRPTKYWWATVLNRISTTLQLPY